MPSRRDWIASLEKFPGWIAIENGPKSIEEYATLNKMDYSFVRQIGAWVLFAAVSESPAPFDTIPVAEGQRISPVYKHAKESISMIPIGDLYIVFKEGTNLLKQDQVFLSAGLDRKS